MSKKIEIFIACHKPSYLPENDLFVPIHVGAKNSKFQMSMQRDDEGENISEKNPQYCELTAQYWAYKHSDADYIGLCHYRRFLSFSQQQFQNLSDDNRKQVLIPALTSQTAEHYGLTDKEQMTSVISDCDIVVAKAMDLSKVKTPRGKQKTVLRHWLAHDRALIRNSDLKALFDLVKEYYPQIYTDLLEYMNGRFFYGYNTFVMRKDLFREMCSFEFDILEHLENKVDLTEYSTMLSRIYGFMGEILFSAFVYHKKKHNPELKVSERQMLYFDYTEPEHSFLPLFPEEERPVQIVIDTDIEQEFLAQPVLKSLLKHISSDRKYDIVIILHRKTAFYEKYYNNLSVSKNIRIRTIHPERLIKELDAALGEEEYDLAVFLPWILPEYRKCLLLRWNTLVNQPLEEYFDITLANHMVAGTEDVVYAGRMNGWKDEDREYAAEVLGWSEKKRPVVLNDGALLLNLDKLRNIHLSELIDILKQTDTKKQFYIDTMQGKRKRKPTYVELLGITLKVNQKLLPQETIHTLNLTDDTNFYIGEAPLKLSNAYKAVTSGCIDVFDEEAWWSVLNDPAFYLKYWEIVKESPLEEVFREGQTFMQNQSGFMDYRKYKEAVKGMSTMILPYGSHRRETVKKVVKGARDIFH